MPCWASDSGTESINIKSLVLLQQTSILPLPLSLHSALVKMYKLLASISVVATLVLPTCADVQQHDFTGIGHIYVLQSDNWQTASPKSKVGCLNEHGKFVKDASKKSCGVFSRLDDYPYTLSTLQGNCTFDDATQERNKDSLYGQMDYAWTCKSYKTDIYDELYTIVSNHCGHTNNSTINTLRPASLMSSSASAT